ncbi:MAG: glycosyltransferase family 9 protein [Alphaproteobacteria bacterium]|nr:glycosyltransferase family 9 protein [Alphaproteobacteria bacterium]
MTHNPKILVIQPRSGIGDALWHLPYLRALAKRGDGGHITLFTKPLAGTKVWLSHDHSIKEILYMEGKPTLAMAHMLRTQQFDEAWILHTSLSYALVAFLARIPIRIGPGFGAQGLFTTNKRLPSVIQTKYHVQQMEALMDSMSVSWTDEDARFCVPQENQTFIHEAYAHLPRPWVTFGVGASVSQRVWPKEHFATLALSLKEAGAGTIFICGAPSERPSIDALNHTLRNQNVNAVAVHNLKLLQTFALLEASDLFIGNDSGLLNASASVGVPSVGLFAVSPVLTHSKFLYGVVPQTASTPRQMSDLTPQEVYAFCQEKNLLSHWSPGYAHVRL